MGLMILLSIVIYAVGFAAVYHSIPLFEKSKKIKFIAIGVIATLVITMIICSITSSGIKDYKKEMVNATKNISILIFAPINLIVLVPYIGNSLNKLKDEKIDEDKLKKRIIIAFVILVVLIIIELSYIKNFQIGLLRNTMQNLK